MARPTPLLLLLVVLALASLAALASAQDDDVAPAQRVGGPPQLLRIRGPERQRWTKVGQYLWDYLLTNDHDYYDANGDVVPRTYAGVASAKSGVQCGRFARQWIRMVFHECGTYSKFLRQYGCNGSIRKEMPATDPWLNYTSLAADGKSFTVMSGDVFDQFKTNGTLNALVDREFSDEHPENSNTGFAASVAVFYSAKLYALSPEVGFKDISFADILVYAGSLALARCQGPYALFVPGRKDASVADPEDMLPSPPPADDFHHILQYFLQQGMSQLDGVVLLASHTTACFAEGCLDATPNKFDSLWAQEVLGNSSSIPVCRPLQESPAVPRCRAGMDSVWLEHPQTVTFLQLLASPVQSLQALQAALARVIRQTKLDNYDGLVIRSNLCNEQGVVCPGYRENFAMFNLFASSWWRLVTDNIPAVLE